jgi:flagellar M-ring protein FliF
VADNNTPIGSMFGIFNKLSAQQKMLMGAIVIVTFVLIGFVMYLFNQTTYTPLFSNLDPKDEGEIVDYLDGAKIPYKITENGTAIEVPQEQVYKVRLKLATKGIPNSGIVGYELFDKNNLGMSNFMQKLNYKRAIEGELSKTLAEISGVKSARVQIVIPEKSVFKDEQKKPTASVSLQLIGGNDLSSSNIKAVQHLVASSVEGMNPNDVTVLDTQGHLLSRQEDDSPLPYSGSKQYEMKRNIEKYLSHKAQSILDNVLGYGSAVVKVNADLDFKRVERTLESYDPESQVAVSEQVIKSSNAGKSVGDSSAANTQNTITNYELSKTIEKVMEGAGNIKRVTVAVVVNGIKKEVKEGDVTKTVVEPRPDTELQKLKNIVVTAVGFDANRNDEVSIVSIPFENQLQQPEQVQEASPLGDMNEISKLVMMLIGFIASMLVLKGLMKKLKNEKITIGTMGFGSGDFVDNSLAELAPSLALSGGSNSLLGTGNEGTGKTMALSNPKKSSNDALLQVGNIEDELSDAAIGKKVRKEKITNYVKKNPAEAAKLINSWLREDGL